LYGLIEDGLFLEGMVFNEGVHGDGIEE